MKGTACQLTRPCPTNGVIIQEKQERTPLKRIGKERLGRNYNIDWSLSERGTILRQSNPIFVTSPSIPYRSHLSKAHSSSSAHNRATPIVTTKARSHPIHMPITLATAFVAVRPALEADVICRRKCQARLGYRDAKVDLSHCNVLTMLVLNSRTITLATFPFCIVTNLRAINPP